jgi:hypothetical protein
MPEQATDCGEGKSTTVVPGLELVVRHPGHRRAGLGQIAEDLVDQRAQFLGRDVAGGAHDHAVAGQHGAVRVDQIVAGQRADALRVPSSALP